MSAIGSLKALRSLWVGLLGSISVAWASCAPGRSFDSRGWNEGWANSLGHLLPYPADGMLLKLGVLVFVGGWLLLYVDRDRLPVKPAVVLAVWSLPLLFVPPVLSQDAALYADIGWTMQSGANPYEAGLALSGGPFAAGVDPAWAGSGVPYPPLSLLLDQAVVTTTGARSYWSVVAMRVPALMSVATMLWLVPRIAARVGVPGKVALILGVLNPLVILHFVGGAHSDALEVALVLLAVWAVLAQPTQWMTFVVSPVVIGLAMAVKPQAGLAVVAVAGLPVADALAAMPRLGRWLTLAWRMALVSVVTVTTFVVVSLGTGLGFGWVKWLDLMGRAPTLAPMAIVDYRWLAAWGAVSSDVSLAARPSTYILAAVVVLILFRFADRPLAAAGWGSFAVAVLGQALQPWYLPLGLVLLALVPLTKRQGYLAYGFAAVFLVLSVL
jgi:hypothetical protein